MKTRGTPLWLLAGGAALILAAALAKPQAVFEKPYVQTLQEARLVRNPFASSEAQQHLREHLLQKEKERQLASLLPRTPPPTLAPNSHVMGWVKSDAVYWEGIPPAARDIPSDWSQMPCVRFENTELGGIREIRFRSGSEYDQWFLSDPLHELTACISIQRTTKRIYFMEIGRQKEGKWSYHAAFDNCYSCHASGLRVIRPFTNSNLDLQLLARFNRRILAYAACDFGESVDADTRGEPNEDAQCVGCHDGKYRGKLYQVHSRSVLFKTEHEKTMPP